MTVESTDIKFRKSVVQTDTDANGGRKGTTEVVSGARHALFPRVTKTQRENGLVRSRKEFYCNENTDDETAYGVLIYMMRPSNAGDRFYMAEGTQRDTQADYARRDDIDTYADTRWDRTWTGAGQLETALSGGEEQVSLTMENSDFQFENGGYLYLSNNTMTGQTIDADAKIGDSVYFSGGSWSKVTHTDNITYPYGWMVDTDEVLTKQTSTNEEFLQIATKLTEDEAIGTGDGASATITLSDLANGTNGICRVAGIDSTESDHPVVVTAPPTGGGDDMKARFDPDGSLDVANSDASAGELDMTDGTWTTDITWDTAPASGSDNITITYAENAFFYSGNVATIELAEQVANAYSADGTTYGAGCIYADEVECSYDSWTESSSSGTYDESSNPPVLYNDGTVEDDWTLTFSDSANFSVSGAYYGSIGSGSTGTDFEPVNSDTGQPYMKIESAGWGGTWAAGETITFTTHPSAVPILLDEEVPAGTTQEPNNLLPIGSYTE